MKDSYRNRFESEANVENYERNIFAAGSYGTLLWTLEQQYLELFLQRFTIRADEVDYLDFACGTGRVLAFMEPKVGKARGIEISADMLKFARRKVTRAELINADITAANTPVEHQYDLITAFRFVLNAEPELRLQALQGLAARLKDDRSRLIFNVHAHLPSHKLLIWPKYQLMEAMGKNPSRNYLTKAQVEQLATRAGLEIEERFGYDIASSRSLHLLPYGKLLALEQKLAGKPVIQRLGGHQLYVARKTDHDSP